MKPESHLLQHFFLIPSPNLGDSLEIFRGWMPSVFFLSVICISPSFHSAASESLPVGAGGCMNAACSHQLPNRIQPKEGFFHDKFTVCITLSCAL